jgi:hypothetical protein
LDVTPSGTGWFDVDLSSYNIVVSGDFYVAAEYLDAIGLPGMGLDHSSVVGRSYVRHSPGDCAVVQSNNLMIRADVDQVSAPAGAPVGGFMEAVNKVAVFAPYLALFGVMAVVLVAVAPWKKREN